VCVVFVALLQLSGSQAATGTPDQIGQWSAPITFPLVAVNMTLEPTGQVLMWDGWDLAPASMRLFDPVLQTFIGVPYSRNLFCAGHTQLADGRTLIAGGHVTADVGTADTTLFDSRTDTYTRGPDMSVGRWYPTVTQLADGRALVLSGDNIVTNRTGQPHPFKDAAVNSLPEIYNPKTNSWTDLTSSTLTSPLYPFMFLLSNGKVFDAGPDTVTRTLDTTTGTWTTVGTSPFDGMSAVMYRPDKIMKAGTWADPDFNGANVYNADGRTAVIDMGAPSPAWRSTAPMAFGRAYENLTMLADGTVLASGGMSTSDGTDLSKGVLPAEIWNPDTETWTTVASLANPREYHSTAMLLPDGRVLMAGGGALPGATDQKSAEIYSPPYLFKGTRPTISSMPGGASFGSSFDISTPDAASITKVSLIRSPSVTHAFDQNQRFQFLNFTQGSGKITVQAPATANLAPPGDYLLFIVNSNGVPSQGKFIRISSTGDVTPPSAPANLTANASSGQVALSWGASSDASGIANYTVYRSTTPNFTPTPANQIAQPTGTSYTDLGRTAGTYYYRVTADDNAANTSASSNEVTAVVPTGPLPGMVAAYGFDEGSGTTTADQSGNNNTGTLSNATWSTSGKFGKALSFNGTNAWVTVNSASSLDLTTGMTAEAWVNPTTLGAAYRTLVFKEGAGGEVWTLYGNQSGSPQAPLGEVHVGGYHDAVGTGTLPTGAWTHVAMTFDGSNVRLYINGTLVSTTAAAGSLTVANGALRIGGNNIWGEYFSGLIDEVRVYNRALSAAEIQQDMTTAITPTDSQPPSAPGSLSASGSVSSASLSWSASSDNVGVVRYDVYRSTSSGFTPSAANRIAQPSGTSYSDTGLAAGTYYYKVQAEDAAGNLSAASNEASAVVGDTTPPSAPGTLNASGAIGKATLSWGAATDNVGVVRYDVYRSTSSGFTPSAANRIAQPSGTGYVDTTGPGTYYYKVQAEDAAGNLGPASNEASAVVLADTTPPSAPANLAASVAGGTVNLSWSASSDDVGVVRYDVYRGTSSGFTPTSANRIAQPTGTSYSDAGLTVGTYYYKVQAEDAAGNLSQSSNEAPATVADTVAPSAPTGLAASPIGADVTLTWNASTDNVGVTTYDVYRSTSSGFTPSAANRIAQTGSTTYTDLALLAGTYYYKVAAEDAAGNVSAASNQATATIPDTTPPTAPANLTATGGAGQAALSWSGSTDNIGVVKYDLYRSTTSGFTPSAGNRIAQPTGTSYTDSGLAAGTYYYKVQAEDAAGNLSAASNQATATVTQAAPTGLVAAYGFDEGSGTTTADRSGNNNTGTLSNATWSTSGKFGNALSFNGTNAWVTVNSSSSVNFTSAMTVEAWVNPSALGNPYRTVVFREQPGNEVYVLYANETSNPKAPVAEVYVGGYKDAIGTTTLATGAWTHLAETFDGSSVRLYVNGTLVSTTAAAGALASSTSPLRIGGNNIWGEYFSGLIDEVRVYNRALSAAEIQQDMTTAITPTDSQPPSAPGSLSASGSVSSASLSWSASSDNVGVVRYDVYRSTSSGFTPSAANRIAQPSGTSYSDTGLAAGTYYYKVQAEDAAGNLSAASNEASAVVGDTTPPSAPGTLNASGAIGKATLSWGAATDNVGVVRYDVYRSTSSGFTPSAANRIAQPSGTGYVDTTGPGTYYYKVQAEDAAGNLGPASNEASAVVLADTTPPSAPANLAASVAGGTVNLSWSASSDDVGVVRYDVYRGTSSGFTPTSANRIAQPTGTSYSDAGLTVGTYYYKVQAEDAAGNLSQSSNEAPATVADTVAPSAPTGLAASPIGADVTLTWNASTDNVGVTTYDVYRSTSSGFTPSAANRIAQTGSTTYTDLALLAGTYYYKVAAEDAAGNVSAASNQATATIPDTTPPTAPANLTATGGAGQAALSWSGSTDNIGVVKYDLYRSTTSGFTPSAGNRIAQPTGTSYTDSGLAAGTYYYKVQAEDAAGNLSAASNQATATVTQAAPTGLVAAYGFDEGSGTTTADRSGNNNTGTLSNATWSTSGKFGNALFFNGTSARVNVNDSSSLDLTSGMTLEAWVKPTLANTTFQTVLLKAQSGNLVYSLYSNTDTGKPDTEAIIGGSAKVLGAPSSPPIGSWSYLTATYDGSNLRLFLNGTQIAQQAVSGSITTSTGALGIGGNSVWGEWFNGWIDEVRIYNRALSASEIQNDMFTSVTPDTTPPTITAKTPAPGSAGINVGTPVTATFNEFLRTSTINSSTFLLKDSNGNTVPASVSYDSSSGVATLTPQAALQYGATYTATVKGGAGGVTDYVGNPLAADVSWSFTTEASPPQLLVVTSSTNPFGSYLTEILRNEGVDAFTTLDASLLSPTVLGNFDVVLLGDTTLTPTQVSTLSTWVNGGGKLIAMHPDAQLAGLLGLSSAGSTLANAYLKVDTSTGAGVGITGQTIQYHGSADRYTLNGATSIATLYSNATTATSNPATTLRSVGSAGGQAAAFTYDLARSVVYTRQGNPAWASQERDGVVGIRPDDMFYGAKTGDVQPDWLDTSKIAIPQADEQQRLLVNLITQMERSKLPLPHFWYLPRGLKAVVVMSGDDHAFGGTASNFDRFKQLSPPGCVVANWQCVRATSYVYPGSPLTNAQAAGYIADGFEVALHPQVGACPTSLVSPSDLAAAFDSQLAQFQAQYPSVPPQVSSRTHCVYWPDWASEPKIELARGMRMDGNYYHYPAAWIGSKPGFLNGGGFPMRFSDLDGSLIDVYQENTNMTDESGQSYPSTVDTLLDNALGPLGYYGAFGVNIHNDNAAPQPDDEAIVASAQARGVPLISYKQLLTWTDGRNGSTIRGLNWSAGTFTFVTTVGAGANGLQTLLPTQGPTGTLSALTCGGSTQPYTLQVIKGIQYAMFDTVTGTCRATYS
jgi:fibronectin type 3 domain-containing protein